MDIWTTAKEILLLEEAQSCSATTLAYGLCKPPQFHPPPVELVDKVITPVQENVSLSLRQRELGHWRNKIPAKERTIISLSTSIQDSLWYCSDIKEPKGESV